MPFSLDRRQRDYIQWLALCVSTRPYIAWRMAVNKEKKGPAGMLLAPNTM